MKTKKQTKHWTPQEQQNFLKGLFIGMGSAALFAGIGIMIYHQLKNLKDNANQYKRLYSYSTEGNILPDSDLASSTNPRFLHENEMMEKDFENRAKEFEDIEEATKNLRDMM